MNWINAIKELDNVITKWILIAIIGVMAFLMSGCNTIDGFCDDTKLLNRAGQRAFKSYSDRQSGYYASEEAELDAIVGR